MLVKDLMTTEVATLSPGTSIKAALVTLTARTVTAAPVVDSDGVLVGIVSGTDLVQGHLEPDPRAHLARPVTRVPAAHVPTVASVMTSPVHTVHPSEDLTDALDRLTRTGVRSLPVVDDARRVVGVISRSDLTSLLARSDTEIQVAVADLLRQTVGGDWEVEVSAGSVRMRHVGATIHDIGAAELLAGTVPGVLAVEPVQTSPLPSATGPEAGPES
jgi:CBS domain-containing protein